MKIIIFLPKNANSFLSSCNDSFHRPFSFLSLSLTCYLHSSKTKKQPKSEIKTTHFHTSLFILFFWCFMVLHLHLIFFSVTEHRTDNNIPYYFIILWPAIYHSLYKFMRSANKRYVFAINKDLRHRHTVVTAFAF